MLVLVAFALYALVYGTAVPLREAPDEPQHYDYVAAIVSSGFSLPEPALGELTEAHQPPLHDALAAAIAAPFAMLSSLGQPASYPGLSHLGQGNEPSTAYQGTAETFPFQGYSLAYHAARLISVLAGAVTVLLTVRIAALLSPAHPALMLLAGVLAGRYPQFPFTSIVVNCDAILSVTTGGLLQPLLALRGPASVGRRCRPGLWRGLAVPERTTT
ncbi:MAG: hypothetical protein ACYC5O_06050 [Anaerolineae bacterium]